MPEGTLISHSQSLIRTLDSKVIGWVSREKALDPLNFSDGQRPQTCGPQRAPPGILSPTGSVTLLRVSIGYRTKLDMTKVVRGHGVAITAKPIGATLLKDVP